MANQAMYGVNVKVGNPPQPVTLLLDTGSSDTWMFGPKSCDTTTSPCVGGDCEYRSFYPGNSSVDILGLDIYSNTDGPEFRQSYYSELIDICPGKPVWMAETGDHPTADDCHAESHH